MNQPVHQSGSPAPDEPVSLKTFLLTTVLWLPLAFFLWFMLRSVVVFLPIRVVEWGLLAWMPDVFASITQEFSNAVVMTRIAVAGFEDIEPGKVAMLSTDVDALMYCYGWPILLALVMATPLNWRRTFAQMAIGFVVLIPAQTIGLAGEVMLQLSYNFGDTARAAIEAHGISQHVIAFWYQFGYLILPPITPVVAWILMNRTFIEAVATPPGEPPTPIAGPNTP